jgi:hypothetical protein
MIFFEHLFIIIAKPYIKIWSKYKDWWVGVRHGITLLILCNMLTIAAVTKGQGKINEFAFMLIFGVFYFLISFLYPKLNNKDFVKSYDKDVFWKRIVVSYIIASVILCILTFLIFIVGL